MESACCSILSCPNSLIQPFHEDFPSTIDRLRLCLINAALLTQQEMTKYMRVTSMGPQMCVRIFVRHAIRHGKYRLYSLGDGANPSFPRQQQDGTEQPIVFVIPKAPKPYAVKKLEDEVKTLITKLEKSEEENKALTLKLEEYEAQQNQRQQNQRNHKHRNQNRQNHNVAAYNNNQRNHGRHSKSQWTPTAGQDHKLPQPQQPSQPPSGNYMPCGYSTQYYPRVYNAPGVPMSPSPYEPVAVYQPYHGPSRMYGTGSQPPMTMPPFPQRQVFPGTAPQVPRGWAYSSRTYSEPQPSFASELTARLDTAQHQEQVQPPRTEPDAYESGTRVTESGVDMAGNDDEGEGPVKL